MTEEIHTKKQITFRGKSKEDLLKLDVREFAKLLKSKARRSVLRRFQFIENFVGRAKNKLAKNKQIRTHSRGLIIVPELVGMKIHVHSGNKFTPVEIAMEMLGHRLGEFAPTRNKVSHGKAGVGSTKGSKAQSKH